MKDEELFKAWKSEQYKDQSTEERMEFVEHLNTFPKYFEKTFLAGLKAGRPQWHYVEDGDFPKDETEKEYLVALKFEYSGFHYEIDIWCKSLHCFASNNPINVYAWKEIVPPKESE